MKQFAVIGNPIKYSLSPVMHNWIFRNLDLQAKYKKIHVHVRALIMVRKDAPE